MDAAEGHRRWGWLWVVLLSGAVLAVYLPAVFNGFVYDDEHVILKQAPLRSLGDAARLFAEPHFPDLPYYRPVTRLTLALQKTWHGNTPWPFHAFNAVLMGLAALLAYALLRLPAFAAPRPWAWLAAALFALHPAASSCVYPAASGRETLLPAVLMLGATYAFLRAGRGWRALSLALFALALFSKEQAIVLPLVLLAAEGLGLASTSNIERPTPNAQARGTDPDVGRLPCEALAERGWTLGVGRSSLLGFCLPALLIVAAYLLVRHALFAGEYKLTPAVFEQPWRPLLSYVYALQTHVAPFRELVYEPVESVWLSPWRLGVAGLAVVVLGGLAFRRSSWRVAVFWLLWYVVLQLPTANLLRQEALFDERYTFLALLGLLGLGLLAARNAWEWPRLRVEVTALLAVAVVAAGWVSAGRRAYFGDDRTFFQQWLRTNPRHARAYYFLGTRLASLGQTQDAAKMFAMALVLNPELPAARYNLANTLLALGQAEKALPHYESAVALRPDDVRYRSNWGVALLQCGRPGQARQVLQTAVALEPRFANAHHNLGMAYAALNDLTNAVAEFRLAADLSPDQADPHFNLGRLLLDLGRTNEAAAAFRNVLRIDPDDKEARKTLERIR